MALRRCGGPLRTPSAADRDQPARGPTGAAGGEADHPADLDERHLRRASGIDHTHYALTVAGSPSTKGCGRSSATLSVPDEHPRAFGDAVRGLSAEIHVVARDRRSAATLSHLMERSVDAVPDIATFLRPAERQREGRDEREVILVPNQHQAPLFDGPDEVAARYRMVADALGGIRTHRPRHAP